MNQITTTAIVLSRIDYGEADRILTLLTPDQGKLSVIAKGVRRVKSKLAGGIELFSVSEIGFIRGRAGNSGMGTLVSTRLIRHYGQIVSDINRTLAGYELIKQLHKATQDEPESEYYDLLEATFAALDDTAVPPALTKTWFLMRLLQLGGHTPNLINDTSGQKLTVDGTYRFDHDSMAFLLHPSGQYTADDIKFLRLGFAGASPAVMAKIQGLDELLYRAEPLVRTIAQAQLVL